MTTIRSATGGRCLGSSIRDQLLSKYRHAVYAAILLPIVSDFIGRQIILQHWQGLYVEFGESVFNSWENFRVGLLRGKFIFNKKINLLYHYLFALILPFSSLYLITLSLIWNNISNVHLPLKRVYDFLTG